MTETTTKPTGLFGRWNAIPLYFRILIAMGFGLLLGLFIQFNRPVEDQSEATDTPVAVAAGENAEGENAAENVAGKLGGDQLVEPEEEAAHWTTSFGFGLKAISSIILQLLGALAPPLILVAVIYVLMTSDISGADAGRLAFLLILNTTVAIFVGLGVANFMEPGKGADDAEPEKIESHEGGKKSPLELLVSNIPKSLFGPLGDKGNIIGVIFIAVGFGLALRGVKTTPVNTIQDIVKLAYDTLIHILHWVIALVPLGVFAIVAEVVGTKGFDPFKQLAKFIVAVLIALGIQTCWYLFRIRLFSRFKPLAVLSGIKDALVMAFSTDSSTITMPVTFACLKDKVGVKEEAASLGALVGANFNNDGTALYEAMAALFVAQMVGMDLSMMDQLIVVFTSIIASVGAAGIPEAGLVTMTLVFTAVGLPVEYIGLLLTVDWFLDRCRTTINVLGDVNVSCLLDSKMKTAGAEA